MDGHIPGPQRLMERVSARSALLLINRSSRQGALDLRTSLEPLQQQGVEMTEVRGQRPGDLARAVAAHRGKVDLVIIAGGDGTLNGVADALVETDLPLGILPLGTANDLARTLALPTDLVGAGRVIAAGRTRRIDLGCINGKYFFNVASLGLSTHLARALTGETKRRWGVLGYPITLWRTTARMRPFRADIRCDGTCERVRSIQISIGNGRYFGGGMSIAADAAIDDGQLDLVSLGPRGFWRLVLSSPAIRWGLHDNRERARHWRGTEIDIRTRRPMPINTDGEVTTQTPARVGVVPRALSVFVP